MQVTATATLVIFATLFLLTTCSGEALNYEEKNMLSEILKGLADVQTTSTQTSPSSTSPAEEGGCFYLGMMMAMNSDRIVRRKREAHVCEMYVFCDDSGQITEVEQECFYDIDDSESDEESMIAANTTPTQ